ncbi:MAG: nucleotidyltransferase family protein [Tannerella sp.]|jgi:predicted nucleotidyltransferase|nr:nucleotidyltransferase family protein [Tannerella sp.]
MQSTNLYIKRLRDFKRNHAGEYGITRIGIFGSVARGEQKENSDVDIYFESETISLFQMGGLLNALEETLGTKVDLIHKHKRPRTAFLHRIEKDMVYV